MNNLLKTTFLLTLLTVLFAGMGKLLGGSQGMVMALVLAGVMNFSAYWWGSDLVLAAYRAQAVTPEEAPEFYEIIEALALKAGIPMPRLYVIPSASPNAFATGRSPHHAAVAVTHGLFEILNREELEGVLAHELSHVLNRDMLVSTVAAALAGAVTLVADLARWAFLLGGSKRDSGHESNPLVLLVAAVVMPLAALMIQLAVSRSREYGADETGARLAGNPLYLASALHRIDAAARRQPMPQAHPVSAHLFILNPLAGRGLDALFSTHPPVEKRIARLEAMARQG